MKKLVTILILATSVLSAGPHPLPAATETSRIFQLPLSEARRATIDFFQSRNYQVARTENRQGLVILDADRSGIHLQILLKHHSALGTKVTVLDDSGSREKLIAGLWSELEKTSSGTGQAEALERLPVPIAVLDMAEAVVCLYADNGNVDFQASGFIVDRRGLIVTTAHKTNKDLKIKVVFRNGDQVPGRVLKIDRQKDLALIQASGPYRGPLVNLAAGRFYLENGEKLIGVGCPKPLTPQFHNGSVDGPPRKAGKQVLWQVRMNVEPGTSGSPVFDPQGRLAGVIKGRYRGTDSIGFVIPFETVLRFLEIF